MPEYAFLLKASTNRVYRQASFGLGAAELNSFVRHLAVDVGKVRRETIGGVEYGVCETSAPFDEHDLAVVSNLSSLHALFEVDGRSFRPCEVVPIARMDEDVVSIQRYTGKTNEAFTHLLVNLALTESGDALGRLLRGDVLRLLDPACGRGTSLNRAVVYGMDAIGIEIDQGDVEAYSQFILTWMKDKRLKHQLAQAKLRKGRDRPAHRITVTYGRDKDRAAHRMLEIIHDDTLSARSHLKARTMDVIVCDLPYGVQHGSRTEQGSAFERGPTSLLREALPVWRDLLVPGGAMALAWNRHTLPRPELTGLIGAAGLELRAQLGDDAFVHRVDRSILRDVLVAVRPE